MIEATPSNSARPTFEVFLADLSAEMDVQMSCTPSTSIESLGFDSIDMYELMLIVEGMGAPVDEETVSGWVTLQDVYRSCLVRND
jgi:acyl carrier protein